VEPDAATYPTKRNDESGDVEAGAVSCPDEEPRWIISKAAKARIIEALHAIETGDWVHAEQTLCELIDESNS
jgi:hypothetical protein